MCAHRKALANWNIQQMSEVGVRFGKGLQLTNIVKDIAHDLQKGRCYIPEMMLTEAGAQTSGFIGSEQSPSLQICAEQTRSHGGRAP